MTLAEAIAFHQAGGVLSLADWGGMSDEDRANHVVAHRLHCVTQAIRAKQSPLENLAEIDGGRAHDRALLADAVRACGAH